jgi:hypothetical protein
MEAIDADLETWLASRAASRQDKAPRFGYAQADDTPSLMVMPAATEANQRAVHASPRHWTNGPP